MALGNLLVLVLALSPQDTAPADARFTSVLTAAEQSKLNQAMRTWFESWDKWDEEVDAEKRIKQNKVVASARDKFLKDWTRHTKDPKKDPAAHPGDLAAVFDRVFSYPRQSGTGEVKVIGVKGEDAFAVVVPKTYKSTENCPSVLMLPGRKEDRWTEAKEHFDATWKGSPLVESTLFLAPQIDAKQELDPVVDLSTDAGDAEEKARIAAVLRPTGAAQRMFRIDRNRLILDCGRGACGFGLRLATYFPQRFAGVILRHPVEPVDLRLGSLTGMPVAVIASAETKAVADALAAALNEQRAGSCRVLTSTDAYPHADVTADLAQWVTQQRRDLFRPQVVIEPNHDAFSKAYWAAITVAESMHGPVETRPMLKVEADRDANRITVSARGVSQFSLMLSDALIDLDKEFTVVVNGKAVTEKRQRNFFEMTERVRSFYDESYLFPVIYNGTVAKEQGASGG